MYLNIIFTFVFLHFRISFFLLCVWEIEFPGCHGTRFIDKFVIKLTEIQVPLPHICCDCRCHHQTASINFLIFIIYFRYLFPLRCVKWIITTTIISLVSIPLCFSIISAIYLKILQIICFLKVLGLCTWILHHGFSGHFLILKILIYYLSYNVCLFLLCSYICLLF